MPRTLEKSGLEPSAPNRPADGKHCALSTQPNPHLHFRWGFGWVDNALWTFFVSFFILALALHCFFLLLSFFPICQLVINFLFFFWMMFLLGQTFPQFSLISSHSETCNWISFWVAGDERELGKSFVWFFFLLCAVRHGIDWRMEY